MNSIAGALLSTLWSRAFVNDHPRSSKFIAQHSEAKSEDLSCIGMKVSPPSESEAKNALGFVDAVHPKRKIHATHPLKTV
jgi:hypothetical protein